jgi:hypothetical protein
MQGEGHRKELLLLAVLLVCMLYRILHSGQQFPEPLEILAIIELVLRTARRTT